MLRSRWPSTLSCLTLSLLCLIVAGCGVGQSPGGMPAAQAEPPASAEAVKVTIDNFTFDPPELTVAAGTRVTWLNRDDVPHTATSTAKPRAFDSGTLDTDQTFTHTFTAPGTYPYFCAVHPKMTGRIIVK